MDWGRWNVEREGSNAEREGGEVEMVGCEERER